MDEEYESPARGRKSGFCAVYDPFRVLKDAGKKAGIKGPHAPDAPAHLLDLPAQLTTVKDVQAHLRHSTAKTRLDTH